MAPHISRRRLLTVATVGATTGIAGSAVRGSATPIEPDEQTNAIDRVPDSVGLETLADGMAMLVAVDFAPDTDRRYIAQRDGRVYVHETDGIREEPFLDLRETVITGGERGLLGMTLHPEFADNRRLFVHCSTSSRPGTPEEYDHTGVIAEFEATEEGTRAKRETERVVLEVPQPADFHNGGDLAFGPDGYFYAGIGAGGGGGGGGQDVTTDFLGSVLRIDVDDRAADREYAIPDDNPLVDREGLDEYYAWGFRNPWRLSFDDDDFFVADVGENDYEEVNLVEKGGNYGWNIMEGTHCYRNDDCPAKTGTDGNDGERFRDPIIEYPHGEDTSSVTGVSVIGGYVYDGSTIPALEDAYVFGDLLASERLFAATRPEDDGDLWQTTVVDVSDGPTIERILSFGRDDSGEMYVLGIGASGGGLYRIVPAA
ncbi:PQQ-dependent sugar dehydrogenase [Natrinema gelatinilyticum]|uniref:PQQ-dependent sugar dehydrogenase n=1 Tax=Natrinema gelatinilyticum TaxID=2961571 RepID=UPI0020C1E970|nr:PQQ-dependent sugar dehydrogenase [Natrinema gelatinilyticum]